MMRTNRKSQFYLFTALLLIVISLSYFSVSLFIPNKTNKDQNEILNNIYLESQKTYNYGLEKNYYLEDINEFYSPSITSQDPNLILNPLYYNSGSLIIKDNAIKNLVDFISYSDLYLLSQNKKSKLIWFLKRTNVVGDETKKTYYILTNIDQNKTINNNFHIIDSKSNIIYFYDYPNVENGKLIESDESEIIDSESLCSSQKCINIYNYITNSANLLKNNNIQIIKINFDLSLPVKFVIDSENNNQYIMGGELDNKKSTFFGFVGVINDPNNNIISFVKFN